MTLDNEIKISIFCETFNHVNHISECLSSIVAQKTNFKFEILVHDDASTDGTSKIIQEFQCRFPEIIKPIIQIENQYSKNISIWTNFQLSRAKGKYICICEGDDYWTDIYKLQKQFDFLESNPEYGLVYTKVKYYNEETKTFTDIFGSKYNHKIDIYSYNNIPTLSVMIKKSIFLSFMSFYSNLAPSSAWKMMDYPLWIWTRENAEIHFIDEITGVYRILPESLSHSKNPLKTFEFKDSFFNIQLDLLKYFKYDQKYLDIRIINSTLERRFEMRKLNLHDKLKNISSYLNRKNYKWTSFYIKQYSFRYAPKFYLNILRAIHKNLIKYKLVNYPYI